MANRVRAQPQLTVESAYSQAVDHFNAARYSEADKLCTAIIQAVPNHVEAINLLGAIAQKINRHDLAAELFQRAGNLKNPTGTAKPEDHLQRAVAFHQAGRIAEAIECYQRTLELQPTNVSALANMGGALQDQGKLDEAVSSYKRAIAIQPKFAEIHNNLGLTLQLQGKLADAAISHQKAITLKPKFSAAYFNLGNTRKKQGKYKEAVASYKKAIAITPDFAEAYSNLGLLQLEQGELDGAVLSQQKAIAIQPDNAKAYNNLGNILKEQGKVEEAVASYKKAVAIRPEFAKVFYNLGVLFKEQNRFEEASDNLQKAVTLKPDYKEAYLTLGILLQLNGDLENGVVCYQKAIALKPDYIEAHNNLGAALKEQGKLNEAVLSYQKAIACKSDYFEAYSNLGNTLQAQGKLAEAIINYKKAITIKPDCAEAYSNLGTALQDQGKLAEAVASHKKAVTYKPDDVVAYSDMLFAMHYGECSREDLYEEHKIWGEQHRIKLQQVPDYHVKAVDAEKTLRIGFVSGDFKRHSVSYFLQPLFAAHDREKIAIYCYSNSHGEDSVTHTLREQVKGWHKIAGKGDQEVVDLIHSDNIDILVDLSGHTKYNRLTLFAKKPAPIQVTWLGYPNTTGLAAIDYRISDKIADPPGESDSFCVEKLVRLADGFLCYQPPAKTPAVSPTPMLASGHTVFVSFNNLAKLTPQVIKVWSRILLTVPDSKLILKNRSMLCSEVRQRYLDMFNQCSIASERIILFNPTPAVEDHFAIYGQADIGLDPFPYNGTTTTCEALWMGVPVIALRGDRHSARVGASLLTQIGLEELIAKDCDEYVEKAAELAKNLSLLNTLRQGMRQRVQASSLCDGAGFAKKMQDAFRKMWIKAGN
ncbi:MAG: tetratricopeptide repeat protein [Magnetococcales bacterium]|nr:tetratricopeptide repeat protein [Magnetococcales bacterium]